MTAEALRSRACMLSVLCLLLGCRAVTPDPPPTPVFPIPTPVEPYPVVPYPDAPVTPDPLGPAADSCDAACSNLVQLGCPGAKGSPGRDERYGTADDVPCAQACRDVEAAGIVQIATPCVVAARSCGAVDGCGTQ